jgi:hypothetical protein
MRYAYSAKCLLLFCLRHWPSCLFTVDVSIYIYIQAFSLMNCGLSDKAVGIRRLQHVLSVK